ncbi:MAG: Maltoporin (maltose/maltodextrin high-affinity receptor, phage lambda receptor protein) [Nitrospira sp.]|nr:MAG: Maltoporin (maltose/maltodextrin high-affinity receptor, phage lambda receptor protein) [Nitrospira sp.]
MKRNKRRNAVRAIGFAGGLLCALLLAPDRSEAGPITFNFTGAVSAVFGGVYGGANGFSAAQPISAKFTFNSDIEDNNQGSSNIGRYNGVLQSLTVNVGTYQATFSPGTSFIRVTDNGPAGDRYELVANGMIGDPVNGFTPTTFRLQANDPTGNAFTSDSLPTVPPSLSSFASTQLRLVFGAASTRVQGALTSLVPLPAAVWLFGAGLIALVGLGSRGLASRKSSAT